MPSKRRTFLGSCLVLLSGCAMDRSEFQQTSKAHPSTNEKEPANKTSTKEPNIHEPTNVLQFGESYVDTGLELTVETPTIQTTFSHNGETYEMPEGDALGFTPIEFHNTSSEELLPLDGPIFTLVSGRTSVLETHSIDHPKFDPTIRIWMMDDIPTTQRWNSEGGVTEPNESLSGTAVFRVSDDIYISNISIVYESSRIKDDRFGGEIVAWQDE